MKPTRKLSWFLLLVCAGLLSATPVFSAPAHAGTFSNVNKKTKGDFSIETRADGAYLVFSKAFKTKSAPDLKIYLSTLPAVDVNKKNATRDVLLAELRSRKGAQEYKIPADVDLNSIKSVVIYCKEYSVFWAAGDL